MTTKWDSLVPFFGDVLVFPLPPGFEVGTKLKPEHEERVGGYVLLSCLGLQPKVESQVLETVLGHINKVRKQPKVPRSMLVS